MSVGIDDLVNELENSHNQAQKLKQENDILKDQQNSMFAGQPDENLIRWQLELDNILERIDHLLRGHEIRFEGDNIIWVEPKETKNKLFNEYGVQEILRILSMYLNRNTILSNYDEETINWKVYDFANELSDLIFIKYDEMFHLETKTEMLKKLKKLRQNEKKDGKKYPEIRDRILNTYQKKMNDETHSKIKLYPMIVKELVDTVHSSYLRALGGGERDSLRTARQVHQTEPLANNQMYPQNNGGRSFSLLKPTSWFRA